MCPAHGSIRRDFCIVYLIFLTELLGPTPTPLRRPYAFATGYNSVDNNNFPL